MQENLGSTLIVDLTTPQTTCALMARGVDVTQNSLWRKFSRFDCGVGSKFHFCACSVTADTMLSFYPHIGYLLTTPSSVSIQSCILQLTTISLDYKSKTAPTSFFLGCVFDNAGSARFVAAVIQSEPEQAKLILNCYHNFVLLHFVVSVDHRCLTSWQSTSG